MGTLFYGDSRFAIPIEDRALEHVKVVVLSKLRRGESFAFTWNKSGADGGGRCTVWIHPAIALAFDFQGGRDANLNRGWVDALVASSITAAGLTLVAEPGNLSLHPA
jgi:hypothetical protein